MCFDKKHTEGFTLVELLVVMSVAAMLSSVIFAATRDVKGKARAARTATDIKAIEQAVMAYYYDTNKLPPHDNDWDDKCERSYFVTGDFKINPGALPRHGGWNGPYLQSWPKPQYGCPSGVNTYHWRAEAGRLEIKCSTEEEARLVDKILDNGNVLTGRVVWSNLMYYVFYPPSTHTVDGSTDCN